MPKRKHPRVVAQQQPVDYRHTGGLSEGRLVDLSLHGCRIKGPPPSGVRVRLQLWLSDQAPALKVEHAVVRWVTHDQFGVSFVEVPSDVRTRLEQAFQRLQATQQPEAHVMLIPSPSTFSGYDFNQSASDE